MNNKEFILRLSQRMGYTASDTQRMVTNVIDQMSDGFQEGKCIAISGFGTFEIKKKLERIIVNPSTLQRMLVPPKIVLNFKPSKKKKKKVKKGGDK